MEWVTVFSSYVQSFSVPFPTMEIAGVQQNNRMVHQISDVTDGANECRFFGTDSMFFFLFHASTICGPSPT